MENFMSNNKWLVSAIFSGLAFSSFPAFSMDQSISGDNTINEKNEVALKSLANETISTVLDIKNKPRVALALGGGGCKCVAEIGVLRVLEANKIPIDYIVGTSTGATIGAMYAAGMSIDEIEKLYVKGIVQKVMIPTLVPRIAMLPIAQAERDFTGKGYAGITDGSNFKTFLDKTLPAIFEDLKIPFSAVTTDLISGRSLVFSKGNLPIAVQASNSLPPMYKPIAIDNALLVDGAIRANVPALWGRKSGADVVIAVDVDPPIRTQDPKYFDTFKHVLIRITDIGVGELDLREGLEADVLIRPETFGVELMTRDKNLIENTIKNGEIAANQALPKILNAMQLHNIALKK